MGRTERDVHSSPWEEVSMALWHLSCPKKADPRDVGSHKKPEEGASRKVG